MELAEPVAEALDLTHDAYAISDETVRASAAARIAMLSGVKTFPHVAQTVLGILAKPDYTVDEITDAIRKDPSLAAGVLKLANSPFYMGTHPITSLDMAFVRLGRNAVREAIFAVVTMQLFPADNAAAKVIRDHCASVAALGYVLASRWRIGTPEVLFLAGLMHDVGVLLFLDSGEVSYAWSVEEMLWDGHYFERQEIAQMGFSHAVLGGQVLHRWNVGVPIPQLVAFHHLPVASWKSPEVGSLLAVLQVVDVVERGIVAGWPREKIREAVVRDPAFGYLGLGEDALDACWDDLLMARMDALALFAR